MEETKKLIRKLYKIVDELGSLHPNRKFSLDGILVGSLGEVMAEYHYGIELLKTNTKGHDGRKNGKNIQIKTTQRESIHIGVKCEHLIAVKLQEDGTIDEIYNGPGNLVWDLVKNNKLPKNGLYPISKKKLELIKVHKRNKIRPK